MRSNIWILTMALVSSAAFSSGCRPTEATRTIIPHDAGAEEGGRSDYANEGLNNQLNAPVKTAELDGGTSVPPSPGNPEYVTDILIYAGCDPDLPEVAIAKDHAANGCERIVLTPAHGTNGDSYEVAASFDWQVEDPAFVQLECLNGPHDNFCWPHGLEDAFDLDGQSDPTTMVTACVHNDCPLPQPTDCQNTLCVSIAVSVVPNIEGIWSLTSDAFVGLDQMELTQVGRSFGDSWIGVKHGSVAGPNIHFVIDDYLYEGQLLPNRVQMTGTITEMLGLTYVGNWQALRLP